MPTADAPHGVQSLKKNESRRIQRIKRALVDGEDLRDFGRDARTFTAEIIFFGPNYLNEFYAFQAKLNEGTAGKLILPDQPKAVLAMYSGMDILSDAASGESLSVSVSWIEAGATAAPIRSDATVDLGDSQLRAANEAAQKVKTSVDAATVKLNSNGFLTSIQQLNSGLSRVRTTINSALGVGNPERLAILGIQGNVLSTLALTKKVADQAVSFVASKVGLSGSASSSSSTTFALATDPVTGQQVVDFAADPEAPPAPDPLAKPSPIPEVEKSLPSIESDAGAQAAISALIDSMNDDSESLLGATAGRTDDVSLAIRQLTQDLTDLAKSIQTTRKKSYLTPIVMSLSEVLFANGISVDRVDEFYRDNTHIEDILAIPAGEVVRL